MVRSHCPYAPRLLWAKDTLFAPRYADEVYKLLLLVDQLG